MAEFIVERYVPRKDRDAVCRDADRARLASAELTQEGTPVEFVRAIFVPEDETCFYLFEAGTVDAVRAAARRAELEVEHVAESLSDQNPGMNAAADST
jgi:Protein of unknown function (DUF4242)